MRLWIGFAYVGAPCENYESGKAPYITPDAKVTAILREQIATRSCDAYGEMEKRLAQIETIGDMFIKGH
jgi:hypothetical protein